MRKKSSLISLQRAFIFFILLSTAGIGIYVYRLVRLSTLSGTPPHPSLWAIPMEMLMIGLMCSVFSVLILRLLIDQPSSTRALSLALCCSSCMLSLAMGILIYNQFYPFEGESVHLLLATSLLSSIALGMFVTRTIYIARLDGYPY